MNDVWLQSRSKAEAIEHWPLTSDLYKGGHVLGFGSVFIRRGDAADVITVSKEVLQCFLKTIMISRYVLSDSLVL